MKTLSMTLAVVGIALISLGVINWVIPILPSEVIDTTPPELVYSFPFQSAVIPVSELNEISVYAKDNTPLIGEVKYYDNYNINAITLTRASTVKHGIWIPDLNGDGAVDATDVNIINDAFMSTVGDAKYKIEYDFNKDGIIDGQDMIVVTKSCYTYIYSALYTPRNIVGSQTINFYISIADTIGNSAVFNGNFALVSSVNELIGKWYINDIEVLTNATMLLPSNQFTVKFVTDLDVELNVKAIVNGETYSFTKSTNKTWTLVLTLSGTNTLTLIASTTDNLYTNSIVVTVNTPEQKVNIPSIILLVVGSCILIYGVWLSKEEEKPYY